ncbi:MAG TPA: branched-chain amino acid ABC transporter permease [Ktedonosporobacter sp.]|nr:branched-chain amino acid ABC transporter permease [Ktedonosporobacter sp.]
MNKRRPLPKLSSKLLKAEAQDLLPHSTGSRRYYLTLLVAFLLFYPLLDPLLFSYGTGGRLSGYADAGYYIILALGLNIVVGFAGLLDLGYVAFFAIGAYAWGIVGSTQFQVLTGILVNPQIWPWLFWPMLLIAAIITALWGVILGMPTLRLRGDYLAIATLGFGEIIPIVFQLMDRYTNGVNGIVGVYAPKFPGITWSIMTPTPFYYLILALIGLLIFVNIRLRDSRLGRAWVAIRDDEGAAASCGVNVANTKLLAFAAGAFFSGVAGVYHAAKLGIVTPDDFNFTDSIIYLTMVVIGGPGNIAGVILGAVAVYSLNLFILGQLDSWTTDPHNVLHTLQQLLPGFTFGSIRNLIFGALLILTMLFRPYGLLPGIRQRRAIYLEPTRTVKIGPQEDDIVEIRSIDSFPAISGTGANGAD